MNFDSYLIDHTDVDWASVLSTWHWYLPSELTIWIMNQFGDLFVLLDDEAIHMFDVGGGTLKRVANSQDEFCDLLNRGDNANQWLMIPLVDKLVASGKLLKPGYCYGYMQSPVLGGDYTDENTIVIPIAEQYGVNGSIHEQVKNLPDGSKVTLWVTEGDRHDNA